MKYSDPILKHFFAPQNVGTIVADGLNVGCAIVGNEENGALIHFYVQMCDGVINAVKFKAYGTPPLIAACSYATEWLYNKTVSESAALTSELLMTALDISPLKSHTALLVIEAVNNAISHCTTT